MNYDLEESTGGDNCKIFMTVLVSGSDLNEITAVTSLFEILFAT